MTRAEGVARLLSQHMRSKRFELFARFVESFEPPVRILDLGGTNTFWEAHGWAGRASARITLVNLVPEVQKHENIVPRRGDVTDLSEYSDLSFDLVFSNSVIEHLFTMSQQEAMAREARRLARSYWIQTPNYWFPIEPHFRWIGWQWLPETVRVEMLRRSNIGWRRRARTREDAIHSVREIRLLTRRELRRLFPDARIEAERFLGLVKSWLLIRTETAIGNRRAPS